MPITSSITTEPFVLFGPGHSGALGVIAVVTAGLIVLLRRSRNMGRTPPGHRPVCWTLAAILIGHVIYVEINWIATGTWRLSDSLPLHLCDLAHFAVAAALYAAGRGILGGGQQSKNRSRWITVFELAYYWGLAGTVQALITPDLAFEFPHHDFFRFFVGHGSIVSGVLVMVLGVGLRPGRWSALRVWAITNLLAGPIMLFNWLSDSNYMFLCGPPSQPTIYDYFGPWPWSLITLEVVALLMMTVCYCPFWILDRIRGGGRSSDNDDGSASH